MRTKDAHPLRPISAPLGIALFRSVPPSTHNIVVVDGVLPLASASALRKRLKPISMSDWGEKLPLGRPPDNLTNTRLQRGYSPVFDNSRKLFC